MVPASWLHFGIGCNDGTDLSDVGSDGLVGSTVSSASFGLSFEGTNYVQTVTMMAHAPRAELNHSNNPTFVSYDSYKMKTIPISSSTFYRQRDDVDIKNTVSSSFAEPTGSFQKQTYISKIGIYDENKNLIAVANLATPVKKTEERELTFKLKFDI
tara:strand:- start:171 stop:638 length:468 start_codon:yes stop_codon:yes gene_type:complete